MDPEQDGHDTRKSTRAFAMLEKLFRSWGVRAGVIVIFVTYILMHLHFASVATLVVALSLIVWFLSEQLKFVAEDHKQDMERVSARLDGYSREMKDAVAMIDTQSATLHDLIDTTSLSLLSLHDCVSDLKEALGLINASQHVVIEHLALDMTHAWDYFERMLRMHPNLNDVEYRLLILTDDVDRLVDAPKEVRAWSQSVTGTIERIQKDIATLYREPQHRHKKINFEIRKYASMPVVHGVRIVQPDIRCYVAICRWGETDHEKYEWGDGYYHRVTGYSNVPSGQDMMKVFDRYFRHFWQINETVFKFENPQGAGKAEPQAVADQRDPQSV